MLYSNSYICSTKFQDKILQHAIGSFNENSYESCPNNAIGEAAGAAGTLVYPHGRQKCVTLVSAKCGAPSFKINQFASKNADEYELYFAEWDG